MRSDSQHVIGLTCELHQALADFASRHQIEPSQVLLGLCAVSLARVSRLSQTVVEVLADGAPPSALRIDVAGTFVALLPQLTAALPAAASPPVRLRAAGSSPPELLLQTATDARKLSLGLPADLSGRDATVARLPPHIFSLLRGVLGQATGALYQQPLLPVAKRRLLLQDWNGPVAAYPDDCGVHRLLEAQAQRTPTATALVSAEGRLSYAELDARANRLARALRAHRVGAENLVALLVDRGAQAIVALFAVLKAGGAYVPLDPTAPPTYRKKSAAFWPRALQSPNACSVATGVPRFFGDFRSNRRRSRTAQGSKLPNLMPWRVQLAANSSATFPAIDGCVV